jgi:hypothetical protein
MNKSDYQLLRWSVEAHIVESINQSGVDDSAVRDLTNRVMGEFVKALAASQVKSASTRRTFKTFRRDTKVIPPSWA